MVCILVSYIKRKREREVSICKTEPEGKTLPLHSLAVAKKGSKLQPNAENAGTQSNKDPIPNIVLIRGCQDGSDFLESASRIDEQTNKRAD